MTRGRRTWKAWAVVGTEPHGCIAGHLMSKGPLAVYRRRVEVPHPWMNDGVQLVRVTITERRTAPRPRKGRKR